MTWVLFVIMLHSTDYVVLPHSLHDTMASCFEERENIVKQLGEPIVNYQAICIKTDQTGNPI